MSGRRVLAVRFATEVRRTGPLFVATGPPCLLGALNGGRLRARLGPAAWRAYVFRLQDRVTLALPPDVCAAGGHKVGDPVEIWVRLRAPQLPPRVPENVRAALAEAGCDLLALSAADRRQSLLMLREAVDPEIWRQRMDALVAACATGIRPGASIRR
jgi:hypothetical protein